MQELIFPQMYLPSIEQYRDVAGIIDGNYTSTWGEHDARVCRLADRPNRLRVRRLARSRRVQVHHVNPSHARGRQLPRDARRVAVVRRPPVVVAPFQSDHLAVQQVYRREYFHRCPSAFRLAGSLGCV